MHRSVEAESLERGSYLMVLPVSVRPLGQGNFATESAFCRELRTVHSLLKDQFSEFVLMAPWMKDEDYEASKAHLSEMTEVDGWRCVDAYPANVSTREYFMVHLPRLFRKLREEIKKAAIVHAGTSHDIRRPYEILSLVLGALAGVKTISVTDMDKRRDPRMAFETGVWSRFVYLKNEYIYEPIRALQHHLVVRMCPLVLFKGRSLCEDFGRGRAHVKNIFDPAFSPDLIVSEEKLATKLTNLKAEGQPLKLLFFGRFTPYKGVDRMLASLALAIKSAPGMFRLHLMGIGPQKAELIDQTKRLGLEEVVTFSDPVPYGQGFFDALSQHHLMLAAPLIEDTPRSIWDSLAAGVPLLSFETPYYRSVAHESHAIALVPWPSVEDFAARLVEFENDRSWLEKASKNAVEAARANTQSKWLSRRARWINKLFP